MLSKTELKKLYEEYKENFNYLWFKDFNQSEQFFNYLHENKLVVNKVSHGATMDILNGWGYSVRETF